VRMRMYRRGSILFSFVVDGGGFEPHGRFRPSSV
jgi:hypothetical protein